jgi:hypothetical protein
MGSGTCSKVIFVLDLSRHCFCPHSGQKCVESGIWFLHFGQIFSKIGVFRGVPQMLQ